MTEKPPSDQAEKIVVRLPDGMRSKLADAARLNNRSVNAEVVFALQSWLSAGTQLQQNPIPQEGVKAIVQAMSKAFAENVELREWSRQSTAEILARHEKREQ